MTHSADGDRHAAGAPHPGTGAALLLAKPVTTTNTDAAFTPCSSSAATTANSTGARTMCVRRKPFGLTGKSEQLYGVVSPALMGVRDGAPFPVDRCAPGRSVADVMAERTRAFAVERGVDLKWASTDQLTVMTSRPGPDPDHGELDAKAAGAPRTRRYLGLPECERMTGGETVDCPTAQDEK